MKLLFLLLVPLCLSFAAYSQAIYGVNFTASLGTQVEKVTSSGTTYSLHSMPVTNKTITEALFATGTTGAAKASDLAVVYNGGVYVINTSSSNAVVATIAQTGTNSSDYADFYTGKALAGAAGETVKYTIVQTDMEFTLPGQPVQRTAVRLNAKIHEPGSALSGLFMTFMGGSTSGSDTYFQGSIKQNSKVY